MTNYETELQRAERIRNEAAYQSQRETQLTFQGFLTWLGRFGSDLASTAKSIEHTVTGIASIASFLDAFIRALQRKTR